MANPRLRMHKNREILRQKWALDRSHREVARSVGVSVGVVGKTVERAVKAELDWDAIEALDDDTLARRLYGEADQGSPRPRPLPDFAALHIERQRKGVTLQLLHLEYLEQHPKGYRYTQFCDYYRAWLKRQKLSMKIRHYPGDKAFVDYSGAKLYLTDPKTGEHTGVEVSRPCRYDPKIQRTYEALAEHYWTTVIPARPRELFEALDRPALKRLPLDRFQYFEQKAARVNIDYHIAVDGHYYSVPYTLAGEVVEARYTASTVEVFLGRKRVASHVRSFERGGFTTIAEHMPRAHREALDWNPSRLIRWARESGPNAADLVETILRERRHPEHGYRACLGICRLRKKYGPERLEAACTRGLRIGARSYRNIASILKTGLDRKPLPDAPPVAEGPLLHHTNIRGPRHYN